MADTTNVSVNQYNKAAEFIIMSGWILLVVICFTTILAICYMSVFHPTAAIPDPLEKLAFTSAGFLFGSFPTMVKDLLLSKN